MYIVYPFRVTTVTFFCRFYLFIEILPNENALSLIGAWRAYELSLITLLFANFFLFFFVNNCRDKCCTQTLACTISMHSLFSSSEQQRCRLSSTVRTRSCTSLSSRFEQLRQVIGGGWTAQKKKGNPSLLPLNN